jgi:hypothetical protein
MEDKMRSFALSLALLAGCGSGALPGGGDGGSGGDGALDNDGSAVADLAGSSCGQIASSVASWLASHQSCQVDSDCTSVSTACGLSGDCGSIVNTGAPGPYLMSLVDGWNQAQCGTGRCTPCPLSPQCLEGCNAGVCGCKQFGAGQVGDACTSGAQCATGECVTIGTSKLWNGGYCTIIDCNFNTMTACPAGSTCEPGGDGHFYCMRNCDPFQNAGPCRFNEGYACCSGPGPQGMVGWCAPQGSYLCTAK